MLGKKEGEGGKLQKHGVSVLHHKRASLSPSSSHDDDERGNSAFNDNNAFQSGR